MKGRKVLVWTFFLLTWKKEQLREEKKLKKIFFYTGAIKYRNQIASFGFIMSQISIFQWAKKAQFNETELGLSMWYITTDRQLAKEAKEKKTGGFVPFLRMVCGITIAWAELNKL